jgi:hypothetical protein
MPLTTVRQSMSRPCALLYPQSHAGIAGSIAARKERQGREVPLAELERDRLADAAAASARINAESVASTHQSAKGASATPQLHLAPVTRTSAMSGPCDLVARVATAELRSFGVRPLRAEPANASAEEAASTARAAYLTAFAIVFFESPSCSPETLSGAASISPPGTFKENGEQINSFGYNVVILFLKKQNFPGPTNTH